MNRLGEGVHRVPWDPVAQKFWEPPLPASQEIVGSLWRKLSLTHSLAHSEDNTNCIGSDCLSS